MKKFAFKTIIYFNIKRRNCKKDKKIIFIKNLKGVKFNLDITWVPVSEKDSRWMLLCVLLSRQPNFCITLDFHKLSLV